GASHPGHAAHPQGPVRDVAGRHRADRHRPDLLPRTDSRTPRGGTVTTQTLTPSPAPTPKKVAEVAKKAPSGLFDPKMLLTSLPAALKKLAPRVMLKNPVMFVVEVGAVASTIFAITEPSAFVWWIVVWLWLTVIFANLAEAVAEGRGKAQAETLRRAKTETT